MDLKELEALKNRLTELQKLLRKNQDPLRRRELWIEVEEIYFEIFNDMKEEKVVAG